LLLRGNYHFNKGIIEDWKKANEYYQQAVAADPNYALAYARLSFSYHVLAGSSIIDPKEFMPKAEAAARRALELDKNLPDARLVLANLRMNAWDWEAAEAEFKRAVELNPNLGDAHREYSFYLCRLGRHDEAIAEAIRAKELDPLNLITNAHVGYALYFARRYDESIEAFQKTLEIDPNYAMVYNFIGYDYAGKRMYQEAITNYLKANRLGIEGSSFFIYLGASYALAGERGKAQEILKQLQTGKEYVSPGELAVLYVALGDKEKAFQLLEKAYVEHDLQLIFLKVDPSFDPLRDDPRYADLIRRVGIPQ
jgi:serine/threonine-protein kinase